MLMMAATNAGAAEAAEEVWYRVVYLHNAVWQWAALLGVLITTFAAGRVISFLLNRQGQRLIAGGRFIATGTILRSLSAPAAMLVFAGGLYLASLFMTLEIDKDTKPRDLWQGVCKTIAALAVGWAVYRLVDVVEMLLAKWTAKTRTQLDDQLVPVIRKALRVFIVIVVFLFIAQTIWEWNIGALLAGLGLGGLAFALAAQDTLKNLFGSVTIFADRPFQLGEWVRIGNFEGVIEQVGFRSTRIRTFYGHLVTIPNSTVANAEVDNVGRRPYIRRNMNITVTYDTPPERLQRGIDIIKEMLDARKDHWPEDRPPKVFFSDFNDASLNIFVAYWYAPPDYWEAQAFNHHFNMELLRRFNEEGIEFAFPTQTLYLKQDSDLAAEIRVQPKQARRRRAALRRPKR